MSKEIIELIREAGESSQSQRWRGRQTITRAPAQIRDGRESDFGPKLVSIGPYFYGRENLKRMEKVKLRCAFDLTKKDRSVDPDTPDDIMHILIDESEKLEHEVRHFYEEENNLPSDVFIKMLIIDSCFIIRVVLSFSQEVQESMDLLDNVNIRDVRSDLLLLENQIPLRYIRQMCKVLQSRIKKKYREFETVLAQFLSSDMPWGFNRVNMPDEAEATHLLDLYWHCSLPAQTKQESSTRKPEQEQPCWAEIDHSTDATKIIPNATALHQMAGITFEELNNAFSKKNLLDANCLVVSFSKKKGILKMPCLKMHSCQTRLLLNLIAFEYSKPLESRFYSNYMKLMDALIDTKKDVELLQQCGVIRNTLSSHLTAATFFNDIGDLCVVDNGNYIFSGLYKDVLEYYNSKWNRRWASLRNNYFSSPWAGISVVAGGTLLILTVLQTFYTVYAYYRPH